MEMSGELHAPAPLMTVQVRESGTRHPLPPLAIPLVLVTGHRSQVNTIPSLRRHTSAAYRSANCV
jgi:hypothetical protein